MRGGVRIEEDRVDMEEEVQGEHEKVSHLYHRMSAMWVDLWHAPAAAESLLTAYFRHPFPKFPNFTSYTDKSSFSIPIVSPFKGPLRAKFPPGDHEKSVSDNHVHTPLSLVARTRNRHRVHSEYTDAQLRLPCRRSMLNWNAVESGSSLSILTSCVLLILSNMGVCCYSTTRLLQKRRLTKKSVAVIELQSMDPWETAHSTLHKKQRIMVNW